MEDAMRIALGLSYDGAPYRGWQTQPHGETIQDTLEQALAGFLDRKTGTICAGRTDAGVHALEQVVHLDTDAHRSRQSWVRGLNALLPSAVTVNWAVQVPNAFHARFSATARTYVYVLRNQPIRSAFMHQRVGWVFRPLDVHRMRDASRRLLGEHDFSCFRSSQCQAASPVRTLHTLDLYESRPYIVLTFTANAFLHHMIRNIVGALIAVGTGKQDAGWIDTILASRDRSLSAPTFSPAGLYLAGVQYPGDYDLPAEPWPKKLHDLTGFTVPGLL